MNSCAPTSMASGERMTERLPEREGEWIDRDQPVSFHFEGESHQGFAGDVLASALWADGVRLLGRSFKYHRPRGIYSLAGADANLMVEDGQRTNLRGDFLPIEAGLNVRSVNTAGGLKRDWLKITDRFGRWMPVGFYYKAFHTPRRLFPFYENQMRKIAGLGKIDPAGKWQPSPKDYAFADLLVAGAGPAGLSAAIAAAEQGLEVLLVDEQPHVGGSLHWQHAQDPTAARSLQELLRRACDTRQASDSHRHAGSRLLCRSLDRPGRRAAADQTSYAGDPLCHRLFRAAGRFSEQRPPWGDARFGRPAIDLSLSGAAVSAGRDPGGR